MSNTARKFVSRAPRYTLRPGDNRYMRFAPQDAHGNSYTTRFIDISLTGLAFVADREHAPQISDLIKVEIPLGEVGSIAWWAHVVRIEEYAEHKWYMKSEDFDKNTMVMVAIRFHELPKGHLRLIHETLNRKFDEIFKEKRKERSKNIALFVASRFWQLLLYGLCISLTVWFLYHFSRPSGDYDAKVGAPWGERFPALNIFGSPESK